MLPSLQPHDSQPPRKRGATEWNLFRQLFVVLPIAPHRAQQRNVGRCVQQRPILVHGPFDVAVLRSQVPEDRRLFHKCVGHPGKHLHEGGSQHRLPRGDGEEVLAADPVGTDEQTAEKLGARAFPVAVDPHGKR